MSNDIVRQKSLIFTFLHYFSGENVHVLYQIQENTVNYWKWSWQVSCQSYGQ